MGKFLGEMPAASAKAAPPWKGRGPPGKRRGRTGRSASAAGRAGAAAALLAPQFAQANTGLQATVRRLRLRGEKTSCLEKLLLLLDVHLLSAETSEPSFICCGAAGVWHLLCCISSVAFTFEEDEEKV